MSETSLLSRYWALLIELVRHVGPFLGLTLARMKSLETVYTSSILQQSVVVEMDDPIKAVSALRKFGLLLPAPSDLLVVNIYGLVQFYQQLAAYRPTTRRAEIEKLHTAVEGFFTARQYPLVDLSLSVPKLGHRAKVEVGRAEPIFRQILGRRWTVLKWRLAAAAMTVAVDRLGTKSELYTFTRCLNMTLERDTMFCPLFSLDRVMNGHRKRGSLGLSISERSVRAALKQLQDLGLISIRRNSANHKKGQLTLNILGIAAVHARDRRSVRSLELYYSTYDLLNRLNREDDFREIFGRPISDYVREASYTYQELHEEVHNALNSHPGTIKLNGHWSDGSCPLAGVTHDQGSDDNPSFGIFIGTNGDILYNCFACSDGSGRPISYLFNAMSKGLGEFPTEAHRTCLSVTRLIHLNGVKVPLDHVQTEILDDKALREYPLLTRYTKDSTGYLKKYLRSRGVTDDAYEHFRVRYSKGDGAGKVRKTLVTEFTNRDGTISALRLRSLSAKDIKKRRGFTTIGSLGASMFGLAQADTSKDLLVVEGEIDAECCYSFGFANVVATGGATRSREAIASVLRLWSKRRVYLGLDCDKAGQDAQDKLIELLGSEVPNLYRVIWAYIRLPVPIRTTEGERPTCKDPADIKARSDFWKAIEGAEYIGLVCRGRRSALSG